jgi:hypothetical protein
MANFNEALIHLKEGGQAKREIVKNDTVIVFYKDELCQMSKNTGVRYPYTLSNEDLMAEDWIAVTEKK